MKRSIFTFFCIGLVCYSGQPTSSLSTIKNVSEIPTLISGTRLSAVRLKGIVQGIPREVILLGENHIPTAEESTAGKQIVNYFDFIGVEGLIDKNPLFFYCIGIAFNVRNLIRRGSVVREKSPIGSAIDTRLGQQTISLELGYKMSLREKIYIVNVLVLDICKYIYIVVVVLIILIRFVIVLLLSKNLNNIVFLMERSADSISRKLLFSTFIFIPLVMISVFGMNTNNRDRYMSSVLIREFKANEPIKLVLVVTGSAHTPKIKTVLKKEYGFIDVGFSD